MSGNGARSRYTTFLVATAVASGADGGTAPTIYAVMTRNVDDALAAVRAHVGDPSGLAVVGSLSTRTAKAIKLKPDEVRAV